MLTIVLALASASPPVALSVPPTDAGRELAAHLSAELDEPIRVLTSTLTVADVLALPPLPWVGRYLVVADPGEGRIVVVRPLDRILLLRGFDPERTDLHAMAVAAAELLDLARSGEETPESIARSPDALDLGFSLALGVAITEAFGHEPLLFQPSIQLGFELIDPSTGVLSSVILAVRVPQVRDTTFADTTIRYRRWEPGAMILVGGLIGDFTIGATLELAAAVTRAEALDASGTLIRREDRLPFSLSAGGLVRYAFGAGFGIQLGASLGGSTSPADYKVKDEIALAEGRFRWQATVAGVWGYR